MENVYTNFPSERCLLLERSSPLIQFPESNTIWTANAMTDSILKFCINSRMIYSMPAARLHDDTYPYEEQEQSLSQLHLHFHLQFHWGCQLHSDCFVLTRNAGSRVGLKLLQCQVGNEKLCMKWSLNVEKVRSPVNEDSDLMVTENYGGEMGVYR